MMGDVNLFLKGLPDEEDFEAEVEIMIAGMLRRSSAVCFHAFDALTSELWTLTLVVLSPVLLQNLPIAARGLRIRPCS